MKNINKILVQDPTKYVHINLVYTPVEVKRQTTKEIIIFWLFFTLKWAIILSLCTVTLLFTTYVAFLVKDTFTSCILGYTCLQAFLLEHLLVQSIFERYNV